MLVPIQFMRSDSDAMSAPASARRDIVTGGIIIGSILLMIGTGSTLVKSAFSGLSDFGGDSDQILGIALLLNMALAMFSWRRYRDTIHQHDARTVAEERVQSLETMANFDSITGLLNRRAFTDQAAALLSNSLRRERAVALLVFDLDNFKNINDVHGHALGDDILRAIAADVKAIAPLNSLLARLDGDEFAMAVVFDPANRETVDKAAEQILSDLSQTRVIQGTSLANISVSLGICPSGLDCTTIDAMLRRADIAMYSAKHQGRNRFTWFDSSMERELMHRNSLESAMRTGIPNGEFEPYFEQLVDISNGRLTGFEMLARWNHPTRGLIAPDVFIPIAEETGLIVELSMSLLHRAFEEARNWDHSLILAVNISPVQLRDPWFAQKLVKLLVETGMQPNRLEIEITETSLYDNMSLAQSIIGSLKNQGIRIALDDFGTGYSSLAHLRAIPFDRIKIDRSFVSSILENAESAAIVNAITRLGDSLGLPVTAEGIEDAAIAARLNELGCHRGQGWYFGKPCSVAQTRTLLAERNLLAAARPNIFKAPAPSILPLQDETTPTPLIVRG
jgi:diguanylate cyclase (GGDEF)-like protein